MDDAFKLMRNDQDWEIFCKGLRELLVAAADICDAAADGELNPVVKTRFPPEDLPNEMEIMAALMEQHAKLLRDVAQVRRDFMKETGQSLPGPADG